MAIDLTKFVDVQIVHHPKSQYSGTRETAVLLSTEDVADGPIECVSYEDFVKQTSDGTTTNTLPFVKNFFDNHGSKLYVVPNVADDSSEILSAITALKTEHIVIACMQSIANVAAANESLVKYVDDDESKPVIYDIYSKLLVASTTLATYTTTNNHRLIAKYTTTASDIMTIPAYLTSIKIYETNSIQDYNFTSEKTDVVNSDDTVLGNCMNNHINIDVKLSNSTRNIGGDCLDGQSITNDFVLIVLHQTLTQTLLDALVSKLKGNSGLSVIKTVMTEELNKYVNNGFLDTTKVWKEEALTYTREGVTYTIIGKNTPLVKGFSITILPFSSRTSEEITLKQTPPIIVLIATSEGIRKIVVSGEEF